MAASARSRPHWPLRPWSQCWCSVARGLWRSPCSCAVSTPRGRRPGWRRAAIRRRPRPPSASPQRVPRWTCAATVGTWSPGSVPARESCPEFSSSGKPSRSLRRAGEDTGTATVLAAVLVAGLLSITLGGVWIGTAALARHRAQAAADLAALAAAGRLPLGPDAACGTARQIAAAMGAALAGCEVVHLDVVVTMTVQTGGWPGGAARAAARAGPAATPQ